MESFARDYLKVIYAVAGVLIVLSLLYIFFVKQENYNAGEGELNINNEDGTTNIVEHIHGGGGHGHGGGGRRWGGGGRRWGGRRGRGIVSVGGPYSVGDYGWPYPWVYGGDQIVDGQIVFPTCVTTVGGQIKNGRMIDGRCMVDPSDAVIAKEDSAGV